MHAAKIILDLLNRECPDMHEKRRACVAKVVEAGRIGGLGLLKMSRQLCRKTALRQRIKCCDRLLSNPKLLEERHCVYRALNKCILSGSNNIAIIIDWSVVRANGSFHLLRAAAVVKGRAFTVYEEVHPEIDLGSLRVHRDFLIKLREVLPKNCCPILVTDAGFRASWFKLANSLNYSWIGRIRNRDMVCAQGSSAWRGCKTLYEHATARPRDLGAYEFAKANPIATRLVLLKKPPKGRKRLTVFGKVARSASSKRNQASQVEPWLLAVSPALKTLDAKTVIAIYAGRMQIEETFRDLKNPQWGLGLSDSQTRKQNRLAILVLLGTLIAYALWLIGLAATNSGYKVQYGSKRKSQATLSTISLARTWCDDPSHTPFSRQRLLEAVQALASMVMRVNI